MWRKERMSGKKQLIPVLHGSLSTLSFTTTCAGLDFFNFIQLKHTSWTERELQMAPCCWTKSGGSPHIMTNLNHRLHWRYTPSHMEKMTLFRKVSYTTGFFIWTLLAWIDSKFIHPDSNENTFSSGTDSCVSLFLSASVTAAIFLYRHLTFSQTRHLTG